MIETEKEPAMEMNKLKPIFKKKEVVLKFPDPQITFGGDAGWKVGEVIYTGLEQERYKPGDKVLYYYRESFKEKPSKLDFFKEDLLRLENETFIICALEDESI